MAVAEKAGRDRVPVEHRRLGMDRRTFVPAVVTLAIASLLIYGFQGLNAAIPWDNEIKAGDVLLLGSGATAVPPVGWQREAGTLVDGSTRVGGAATLSTGGATITLTVAPYEGTAAAFLDQVDRAEGGPGLSGPPSTLITDSGLVGVVRSSSGPSGDGLQAAFKLARGSGETTGAAPALLVVVETAPGAFEPNRAAISALLDSITPVVTS